MPRRGLDPKKAAASAKKISFAEAKQRRIDGAVQEGTKKIYESRINVMEEFRRLMKEETWTENLFAAFLEQLAQAGYASAEGHRAALLHHLQRSGQDSSFLQTSTARKMTESVKLKAAVGKRPRGTITPPMMAELRRWLEGKFPTFVPICVVAYGAALRWSEVSRIKVGDVTDEVGGRGLLQLRSDKRVRRGNAIAKGPTKVISRDVLLFVRGQEKGKQNGDWLFPPSEAKVAKVREALRAAARELKWPEDVVFDGPHCFRHGGSLLIQEDAASFVASSLALQSDRTLKHYQRRNEERR